MSETPNHSRTGIGKDRGKDAASLEANSPAPGGRTLHAGGEFLKALVSDLAVVAARLRRSQTARRRRVPAPRMVAPIRIPSGPSAGRVIWRLTIVILGLGSICAGLVCALMLWVLFGFPLEARKNAPEAAGLRVEAANGATLGGSGAPKAAEPSPPTGAPLPQVGPASGSGSSAPAPVQPQTAAKPMPSAAGAGSDQPQLARTEVEDRPPATLPLRQQELPATSSAAPAAASPPRQCDVSLCAARYRSFHAADCTYQSYGGGPRQICELTSRSADATPPALPPSTPRADGKDTAVSAKVEVVPQPIMPARSGLQCNVALCAGRYKSFSAADCTYEPYGGGPRQICEISSRSADASPHAPSAATVPKTDAAAAKIEAPIPKTDAAAVKIEAPVSKTDETVVKPDAAATRLTDAAEEVEDSPGAVRDGPQCNVAVCAGRYRSFHAADCTYQPLDGGPRRACEP